MSSATREKAATLDDLYLVDGKAELIAGRIVHLMATGFRPHRIAAKIFISLELHSTATGRGVAFTNNMGFAVPKLPDGRQSFSPDAAYYDGPLPANLMRFVSGPPTFAVEVRSEGDYGASAEEEIADNRADYFLAGTLVVWDVDPLARRIHAYRADAPIEPTTFLEGQTADAEPAVPGWRMAVAEIFA